MGQATAENPRVLAVEFDAGRRRELSERLGQWQLDFQVVAGGAAAIVALRTAVRQHSPFDFAIIARDMPRMDGLTLIDAIHVDKRIRATRLVLRGDPADDTLYAHSRSGDIQLAVDDFDGLYAVLRAGDRDPARAAGEEADARRADPHGDGQVFDLAAFSERLDGDESLMRAVAEVFLGDVAQSLGRIRECAAAGDWQRCASIGHRVRGSAVNVGALALAAEARRVEEAGRDAPGLRDLGLLDELQRRFDTLRAEMNRVLGRPGERGENR